MMALLVLTLMFASLCGLIGVYAWLVADAEQSHNRTIAILREEQARLKARAAARERNRQ